MKSLALLLLAAGTAFADTLTYQERPAPPPARWTCAATGYASNGTLLGKCQLAIPSTARYAQPARYIYNVSWNAAGAVTQGPLFCYSPQHTGIDHSGCPSMVTFSDTNNVVTIDGIPYWYVSTNSVGSEAVNNQTDALVWIP
jgi:hypothetical protein